MHLHVSLTLLTCRLVAVRVPLEQAVDPHHNAPPSLSGSKISGFSLTGSSRLSLFYISLYPFHLQHVVRHRTRSQR
jgi:hypothetical protein